MLLIIHVFNYFAALVLKTFIAHKIPLRNALFEKPLLTRERLPFKSERRKKAENIFDIGRRGRGGG